MAIFDRCFAFVNGAVLSMADGGTLEGQGDPLPVDTIMEELAGFTPVPKHMMLSGSMFVPPEGFEFDVFKEWAETNEVTFKLQFGGSGKFLVTKGCLDAPTLKWGAADHTKIDFKAKVKLATFT